MNNKYGKHIMNPSRIRFILSFFLFLLPFCAYAGSFDGSRSLKGSVDKIIEINRSTIKNDVSPDAVGLPKRFRIDFKGHVIRPSKDSVIRRVIKIQHIEHVENKLVLQGIDDGVENIDDGLAWSLVISKRTGKVTLAASGDGLAYVVFGTCFEDENSQWP
jgi:hypothetical protein